jgi:hypothetical protein
MLGLDEEKQPIKRFFKQYICLPRCSYPVLDLGFFMERGWVENSFFLGNIENIFSKLGATVF